ncbi:OB-fold nucleic acid binding domain-containing protein [uncultured Propionibacterium sp.]|uniref:OB-fold nucleic acid binding domain-containing protein n=1 Tax=uncultured Propionibacterium sp. TaxID=218066 RepID=UPI00292E36F7|nr:OB-fold nucleic acid binding domain-containing protein [uncultured Propionibacterium sp.]
MAGKDGRSRGLLTRWFGRVRTGERALPEREAGAGPVPIAGAPVREHLTVQGRVAVLTVNPSSKHRWLEADLTDGTGTVTLIWMGRHQIAGVTPGRGLRVTGLISEHGGRRVMFNPRYELLA